MTFWGVVGAFGTRRAYLKKDMDINIVVSRYNEDLHWINQEPFNRYFITCYNKGINNNFKRADEIQWAKDINPGDNVYIVHMNNSLNCDSCSITKIESEEESS